MGPGGQKIVKKEKVVEVEDEEAVKAYENKLLQEKEEIQKEAEQQRKRIE